MTGFNVPFTGPSGIGNEFVQALLGSEKFNKALEEAVREPGPRMIEVQM